MIEPKSMTKDALTSAYGDESMAHMRYLTFLDVANKERSPNVMRLFKAIAYAEFVHARDHYDKLRELKEGVKVVAEALFGSDSMSKNSELAIMRKEFEVNETRPVYAEIAKFQREKGAEISFKRALETEKNHAQLYKEAKKHVDQGKDWLLDNYIWICSVCGAPRDKYKILTLLDLSFY